MVQHTLGFHPTQRLALAGCSARKKKSNILSHRKICSDRHSSNLQTICVNKSNHVICSFLFQAIPCHPFPVRRREEDCSKGWIVRWTRVPLLCYVEKNHKSYHSMSYLGRRHALSSQFSIPSSRHGLPMS